MKRERYQLITALSFAAAGLGACAYGDVEPVPDAPVGDSPPSSEAAPFELELSPLTVPMTNETLCTNPMVKVNVPEELWGTSIYSIHWSIRREVEVDFGGEVELSSYPSEPHNVTRTLPIPIPGSRVEEIDIKVVAKGPNGEVVGSGIESMTIGCVPIQPTPTPLT